MHCTPHRTPLHRTHRTSSHVRAFERWRRTLEVVIEPPAAQHIGSTAVSPALRQRGRPERRVERRPRRRTDAGCERAALDRQAARLAARAACSADHAVRALGEERLHAAVDEQPVRARVVGAEKLERRIRRVAVERADRAVQVVAATHVGARAAVDCHAAVERRQRVVRRRQRRRRACAADGHRVERDASDVGVAQLHLQQQTALGPLGGGLEGQSQRLVMARPDHPPIERRAHRERAAVADARRQRAAHAQPDGLLGQRVAATTRDVRADRK
eukprot:66388-Prymnesium_polylepis.1